MNRPAPWRSIMTGVVDRRPFKVGEATVDPVSRDVSWRGGEERLQPQTLKVLLALVSHRGEVVTRDELIQLCWDGRIVGDDVINRSISLLRQSAGRAGGFEIETVSRTGYRLIEAQPGRSRQRPWIAAAVRSLSPTRKWIAGIAAAVMLLVVGAVGLFGFERASRPAPDAVMLTPFDVAGNAPLARTFAAGVSADVNDALSAANVDVVDPGASGQSDKAAFVLSGRAELPGSDLHLTAELQDARDHTVLWSTSFTRPASQVQAMQEQVANNLAAVLHCALDTAHQPGGVELDRDTIKLYLKACAQQQAVDWSPNEVRDLLKQVTAREPRFALGWARLAFATVTAAWNGPPQEREAMRREARIDAQTALRLDPKSGLAYEALTDLELGHVAFAELHREFQKVLSFDPNNASVINDDGELLMRMGSLDEGLQMFRRGVALDPLSPEQAADLVRGLINDSRDSEAQATLRRTLRIWPDDNTLKIINVDYQARFGDPDTALSILNDPDARPQKVRDITLEAYRHLAEARKLGQPAQTRAFIAWLKSQVASGQLGADFAAPQMASFGDVDGAFKLALAAPSGPVDNDPEFLWEPESIGLRRDPRFIALAAKFHVADFWRATRLWPDFCSTAKWPYDCKAQENHWRRV
jgi:DNA-binding winged helix-turn-helix (wHTH) protein/TolB-like protein/Tfp pilus assembly protein PilF